LAGRRRPHGQPGRSCARRIEVINPDGTHENTLFEIEDVPNRMTMYERWAADDAWYAAQVDDEEGTD
jgi:hypothetical protein